MKKALLLSFIFLALVLSSATAFTGNNTTAGYYVHGDFDNYGNISNTSDYKIYFDFIKQPVQIKGTLNGAFTYIGFYPIRDNYTYYAPFENGTFIYHCNPDSAEIGNSVICTGTLYDDTGQGIEDSRIEWELRDYNNTVYDSGQFINVGNGVYKIRVDIDTSSNYTTGDYFFVFSATGFNHDYSFPLYISEGIQNLGLALALGLMVLAYAIITTRISGALPQLQSMFLLFAEFMALISLRVFNEMTGYTEFLSGYKVMLWVIVLTIIFLFIELFIGIFLPLIRKKWRR